MKFFIIAAFYTAATALLFFSRSAMAETAPYGEIFTGEGTYYGDIPIGSGNCAMRGDLSVYDGMIPLAINAAQYDGSRMCGACVKVTGTGEGAGHDPITGTFDGFIMDQCPECSFGDLDLATNGDGRWKIEWQFVPCEKGGTPEFTFENSDAWYWKIQATGCKGPVDELLVNGRVASRTDDNFFEIEEGSPYYGDQSVEVTTIMEEHYDETVGL